MSIESVEANDIVVALGHNHQADITCFVQLVCRHLEAIVDLLDAAGKARAIMPFRIERLDHDVVALCRVQSEVTRAL